MDIMVNSFKNSRETKNMFLEDMFLEDILKGLFIGVTSPILLSTFFQALPM